MMAAFGQERTVEPVSQSCHLPTISPNKDMATPDNVWPFEDAPNVACFTVRSIMEGAKPILLVSHDAEDESWQMLTGDAFDMDEAMLVLLTNLVALDESLIELADLPLGWSAWREHLGSPWIRRVDAEQTAG